MMLLKIHRLLRRDLRKIFPAVLLFAVSYMFWRDASYIDTDSSMKSTGKRQPTGVRDSHHNSTIKAKTYQTNKTIDIDVDIVLLSKLYSSMT